MATFGGSVTYERVPVEQLKKVIKFKDMEMELPPELGSFVLPSIPFVPQGTLVPQDMPLLRRAEPENSDESVSTLEQINRFFIGKVSAIPQVRCVAVYFEDGAIHIWTLIPIRDKEVQRKVYDVELQLMERFPGFSYDFTIIFCADADTSAVLPSEAVIIYSKGQEN